MCIYFMVDPGNPGNSKIPTKLLGVLPLFCACLFSAECSLSGVKLKEQYWRSGQPNVPTKKTSLKPNLLTMKTSLEFYK